MTFKEVRTVARYNCLWEAIMTKEPKLEELKRQLRDERERVSDLTRYINELEENAVMDREQIDALREKVHYFETLAKSWEEARETTVKAWRKEKGL